MNIVIEKNGKQVMELCEIYLGCGISQFAIKCDSVLRIITAERFVNILNAASKSGCDIFDYRF